MSDVRTALSRAEDYMVLLLAHLPPGELRTQILVILAAIDRAEMLNEHAMKEASR